MTKPIKDSKKPRQEPSWWSRYWFYTVLILLAVIGVPSAFFVPPIIPGLTNDGNTVVSVRQGILAVLAGALTMLTLSETHRKNTHEKDKNDRDHTRQVYAERRSRYTKAVEQLANEKAAVRLGGIYTLVGLVDEWLADESLTKDKRKEEGQVIINNLCSYIRLPFPLAEKREVLEKDHTPDDYDGDFTADQAQLREEQDVRRTTFEEMSKRSSNVSVDKSMKITVAPGTWSIFEFNFGRAPIFYPLNNLTIEQGNFISARFFGEADFRDTKFTGDANFRGAAFAQNADFWYSTFAGNAYFLHATFAKDAYFSNAFVWNTTFAGEAHFSNTTFNGDACFENITFNGDAYFGNTTFNEATNFRNANFTRTTSFHEATFIGKTNFESAEFSEKVDFGGAEFSGDANFKYSYFEKSAPIFVYDSGAARFSDQVNWADSNFSVRPGSQPIELGSATLNGKTFRIPLGTVVFAPDSWDKEIKKYTHISDPAK